MYIVNTPVINRKAKRMGREALADGLKKLNAKRVFLATGELCYTPEKRKAMMDELRDNCEYFKSLGFEVATWNWSFMVSDDAPFERSVTYDGKRSAKFCCPGDEEFCKFATEYIKELASTGVDMILMDDDFRIAFRCYCETHRQRLKEILGEELPADEMRMKILSGGKNRYRDAFCKVNGDLLRKFARQLREAVDEVNPDIRIGICAGMFTWGLDGTTIPELSHILAGKTKPFARLAGAPYWAVNKTNGCRLQDTFDLMRLEKSWCDDGIELISECDNFPRPRYVTPASFMELYDIAMQADGLLDGIMKYSLEFNSTPDYEMGYVNAQMKNEEIYRQVNEIFGGKEHLGVRVYESMEKFYSLTVPENMAGNNDIVFSFFPISTRALSHCSVPVTYYGDGICSVAFGENVKFVPRDALKRGIILDAEAARLLEEQGIDTGLKTLGKTVFAAEEHFVSQNQYVRACYNAHIIETKEGAEIDSFVCHGENETPGSYYYENKDGDKFFVFSFDAYFNEDSSYRSYARSRQLSEVVKRLSGKALPAYSFGNPDLYIMAKEKGGKMAVGLWNCFADGIEKPVVTLDKEYTKIRFINCEGEISGSAVTLSRMEPYSFAGFEVE